MVKTSYYITLSFFLLITMSGKSAQKYVINKEPFKKVQIFTPVNEFYDDGAILSLYSAYRITTVVGDYLLSVPESINNPHTIQIVPGNFIIEVKTDGEVEKFAIEVDESSFQQFRLQ